jgi:hypothetical protein
MYRRLCALALAIGAAMPLARPSAADAAGVVTAVSSNWAGYAVTGARSTRFRRVTGTWQVPKADCATGEGYAAPWIGLGGFSETSQALEQTGTEVDCTASGRAIYSAWYEIVPDFGRTVPIDVRPGDVIAASVTVRGTLVTLTLRDRTSGRGFTHRQNVSAPDLGSAEWILEAPSACNAFGRCRQLPLGDFGTVPFSGAHATTASGRTGTISSGPWTVTRLELISEGGSPNASASSAAVPSPLYAGGSAFAVSYQSEPPAAGRRLRPLVSARHLVSGRALTG